MIIRIIVIALILIAAVLAFAATKPKTFHVQRSISIKASPEKIFTLLNDFHQWPTWAPQDREDRTMIRTYSGSSSGLGAASDWVSSGSAGKGRMEIVKVSAPTDITIKVDFEKPFEAHNLNEFILQANGDSTQVTWSMQGMNLYVMKIMSIFMNMDRFAGKHFEDGLRDLKIAAES